MKDQRQPGEPHPPRSKGTPGLAPLSDHQLDRYARHIILKEVGAQGQRRLLASHIALVGAGGIGSPAALYLAAAGVGQLTLIDDDAVDLSNLQRQILYAEADVGRPKGDVARDRLKALRPDLALTVKSKRLDGANAKVLLEGADLVIDGSDTFETRFAVNAACVSLGIPLVSAALGPFDGQLATFHPAAGGADAPLPCYQCLVPAIPNADWRRTCSDTGILGAVAGMLGTMAALTAIKEVLGLGDSLKGKLLLVDALGMDIRRIGLPADPACPVCGRAHRLGDHARAEGAGGGGA